jgi:hypothetical protein
MRKVIAIAVLLFMIGCGKDDPKAPEAAKLLFPLKNSECTTGVDQNANISRVEFKWQKAAYTDTYEIRVTNSVTNVTQVVSTSGLSAELPLQKGTPYSWIVVTRNTETQETGTSETWRFYNEGNELSYAPFPAEIIAPKSGTTVFADINKEVVLQWSGADIDNDIMGYEVYFSTNNPPLDLVSEPAADALSVKVSVASGASYYWKILTIDQEGNSSDSGVYGFRVQ